MSTFRALCLFSFTWLTLTHPLRAVTAPPVSGPVLRLDYTGEETNGMAIADFLYFVPLISPEPVTVSESSTNTLRVQVVSIEQTQHSGRLSATVVFDVAGAGFQHYAIDQSENLRRKEGHLAEGKTVKGQLAYIRYEGPGRGRLEIDARSGEGGDVVTAVRLTSDLRGGGTPITVGLQDVRSVDGALHCENERVVHVTALGFSRDDTPPRMSVRVGSVRRPGTGSGFFRRVKGRIVGAMANMVINPIRIETIGNDAMLDFGQAIVERKPSFTFPAATNLMTRCAVTAPFSTAATFGYTP